MSILNTIVERKRQEIEALSTGEVSVETLRDSLKKRGPGRGFFEALQLPCRAGVALIAEVKKASPSAGVIREDFDPVAIAREYETAGASCISVLTDGPFFQGSLQYLKQIRQAVGLPLLRKDFIIDARQILEAVEWGADAILLIVSILSDVQLRRLHSLAAEAGLAVLVEVHNEKELERALLAEACLIGVNNRDLKTFAVDLSTTERLAGCLWRSRERTGEKATLLVAESGIHTRGDVERLRACGSGAILVGESLMREPDVGTKVNELLGWDSTVGSVQEKTGSGL